MNDGHQNGVWSRTLQPLSSDGPELREHVSELGKSIHPVILSTTVMKCKEPAHILLLSSVLNSDCDLTEMG